MQLAFVPAAASPIRRQYLTLKHQYPDAILFFQLGDFFETFEDDARQVAEVCDLALTAREMGRGERVPMAGVPVHAAESYIGRLVERGYHVAICEQTEDSAVSAARVGPSLVRREVTRVITPGTIVEPPLLARSRSTYLAALAVQGRAMGLAYADISTGEFACAQVEGEQAEALVRAEMSRIQAAECLLADTELAERLLPAGAAISPEGAELSTAEAERTLAEHFGVRSTASIGLADMPLANRAAAAIVRYVARTQPQAVPSLERLRVYDMRGFMVLDPATRDHLELSRGARGRSDGSLLKAIDKTSSPMGARMLSRWLGNPLVDRALIEERLDRVEALQSRPLPRQEIQALLAQLPDLERLAGRATQRIITPREALALADGMQLAGQVPPLLADCGLALQAISERIVPADSLVERIREMLVEDPPPHFGEGQIRDGQVAELDELRSHNASGRQWLLDLERRERERTGIKNLKIGFNRVFGYYLEAPTSALDQALDYYRQQESGARTTGELLERLGYQRRQTLTNVERFMTTELREHEAKQSRASTRMAELEREAYDALVIQIAEEAPIVRSTAEALAELDTLASFAQIASERNYARPQFVDEPATEIVGGRHPVVEMALGWDAYFPNDAHLARWDSPSPVEQDGDAATHSNGANRTDGAPQVILLTGPNMAGKTTYGRMVLTITLLAQCGSFVPAQRARLGLVDRIFLRSGAGDDIAGGQSTFMVEMTETAAILRAITPRSLTFFDEVGRGTSTYDGMAIARAIVEYLVRSTRGCRTIFSTHYHELAEIASTWPAVGNSRMEVQEAANRVVFTYRVLPGSADRSYGVHVARLAGLPPSVITRATALLSELEVAAPEGRAPAPESSVDPPAVVYDLLDVDVEHMTPLEALTLLARLRADAQQWLEDQGALAPIASPSSGG